MADGAVNGAESRDRHGAATQVKTGSAASPRTSRVFRQSDWSDGTQPPFIGLHGFSAGTLRLRGVCVPEDNLLGQVGEGLDAAYLASIVCGRPNFAAVALGLHRRVMDTTIEFLLNRPRRGGYLADHSVVRHHLAEMTSRLMTAEFVAMNAVHLLDRGVPCDAELVNSKLVNNRAAVASITDAKTLHGGYATRTDYPLNRLDRDVQHLAAPAGPDDIQLLRLGEKAAGTKHRQWSELIIRHTNSRSRSTVTPPERLPSTCSS